MTIFGRKVPKLSSRQRRELAFKELALKKECRERSAKQLKEKRLSLTHVQSNLIAEHMNATMRSSR
jgi:hypothetical protein